MDAAVLMYAERRMNAAVKRSSQVPGRVLDEAVHTSRRARTPRGTYARRRPAMATAPKVSEPILRESAAPVPVGVVAEPVAEETPAGVVVGVRVAMVLLAP